MSEDKKYSPVEVAQKIIERVSEQLNKSEDLLAKAINTAHEIEDGGEPNDDNAECPASLAASGEFSQGSSEGSFGESSEDEDSEDSEEKKKKKKSEGESEEEDSEDSEDSSMEDEPLQDDDESESEDQDKEKKFRFQKSESGMHSIEYKTLVKDEKGNPSFDREKKDIKWTKPQTSEINRTKPGKIKSSRADQSKFIDEAKKRRDKMRSEGLIKEEVKETTGIKLDDKEQISDKGAEEKKGIKRPMEKCGDIKTQQKSEEMDKCGNEKKEKGVEKLKKFLGKEKQPSPGMVRDPQE